MPPVMGSAAFIMSEFIGVLYLEIARSAIIPAILYCVSVLAMVHFEARRLGLKPEGGSESALKVIKQRGHLFSDCLLDQSECEKVEFTSGL